jgi:hypothetical protein
MRIEKRDGDRCTYVELFNGREIRATTAGGPAAAEKIFAIIRKQNGVAVSPVMAGDLTYAPSVTCAQDQCEYRYGRRDC